MGVNYNTRIVNSGLRHVFDIQNTKSYTSGTTIKDLVTNVSGSSGIANAPVSWMNAGVNQITITTVIKRLTENTAYSTNPLFKYNSTTDNSFSLYVFGNFNNTVPADDGKILLYSNTGGTWKSLGNSYNIALNETVIATWQFNSTNGCQTWINGNKIGGRVGTGIFGSNNNTSSLGVFTPPSTSVLTLFYASIYDKELTDVEVLQNYAALRGRFAL